MNDTTDAVQRRFEQMIMQKTPQERLRMGCSMFSTARQLAESSIRAQCPDLSTAQLKQKIFLRFYGQDFSGDQIRKIETALAG